MLFVRRDSHSSPFKDCKILKFYDRIAFENSILIINPSNINFSNHLIDSLDFLQIFIARTQGGAT